LFLLSLAALDIVLNNTKKKKKKNQAQPKQFKTGHVGRERFVIFSTQVPNTHTNTPKHVKMRYQPTINLTWNQLGINLAFCVQSFGLRTQNNFLEILGTSRPSN
jgi:hypothetical protein